MQYLPISCILVTMICIWLFVISITYFPPHKPDINAIEMYQDSKKMVSRDPIISDRYMYFQAGMQCFFTSFEKTADLKPEEFLAWIRDNNFFIYFWPNYQDLCCKSKKEKQESKKDARETCDCENIDLRLSSFEDDAFNYYNESRLESIESKLGATNKNNCIVTLLGNDYILQKRTIQMKVEDKERVSKHNLYRLTIQHKDLKAFVLSRPLFVSFSGSGLAAVIHEDYDKAIDVETFEDKKERNLFSYFGSSQDLSSHHLLVHDIKDGKLPKQNNISLFNSSKHHPTYKDATKTQACTLYYLSYLKEVHDIPHAYAVNFCVNKKLFDEQRDAVYITLEMDNEDPMRVHKVTMIKKDGQLLLRVNQQDYEIPEEFNINDPYLTHFDICFTLAFNIIIIVCLGKNSVSKQSVVFMKRHHIKKRFDSDKVFLHQAFRDQAPKMYQYMQTQLGEVMCLTAIPNYAKIAYKLGYMNSVL